MAVTKRTRFEVLRRDNYTCRYCRSDNNELTIDHVVPVSLGGSDKPENLVACCKDCNAGKSSSSPDAALVAEVSEEALRYAEALQLCIQGNACDLMAKADAREEFRDSWLAWERGDGSSIDLPAGWEDSVDKWIELGIGQDVFHEAIRKAMTRNTIRSGEEFRYMAGIIWRTLDDLRQEAENYVAFTKSRESGSQ